MKKQILGRSVLLAALIVAGGAVVNAADVPFMKGTMEIQYPSRTDVGDNGNPNIGVKDSFKLDVNMSDSIHYAGNITNTPSIFSSLVGRELQAEKTEYSIGVSVYNPRNPAQTPRAVGRLTGTVPIDKDGVYRYNDGTVRMGISAIGRAPNVDEKFTGLVAGKPPKNDSMFARAKKQAVHVSKVVKGKKTIVVVQDYDKLDFRGHGMAGGPLLALYPNVQVSGEMVYDYELFAWHFNNLTVRYKLDGKDATDRLTGNIRWVKSPQWESNGESEYQFDVRVNEPEVKATEEDVFASADDMSAYFETDPNLPALTGVMKYKDTLSGETVTRSSVTIDLMGPGLTKTQMNNFWKLLFVPGIIPVNSE